MNKLTAEWCAYLLKDLQRQSITGCGIGRSQEGYLAALEIALPILEQQERGEGWIDWHGGKCPISPKTIVVVRYRKGKEESPGEAGGYFWNNTGSSVDIIAYRIIPERPTNKNGEQ